jgi:hypothetical protein
MNSYRIAPPTAAQYISLLQPFSSFDIVDSKYGGNDAMRRCFSLSRSLGAQTLVIEDVAPTGLVDAENKELAESFGGYECAGLKRLSFWRKSFKTARGLVGCRDSELVGYALLKQDYVPGRDLQYNGWHVFEAVFKKYPHEHNCVPCPATYPVAFVDKSFHIEGILYCQQNGLNKACAHVALRSLLSRLHGKGDVSYSHMNHVAKGFSAPGYAPGDGLSIQQMQKILASYGVGFNDIDYESQDEDIREIAPYQKYVYAGVESGCGALLGFRMSGPNAPDGKHIIPFYGHTFNKDTWAPDADISYFNIGANVGYIPSEMWTSSFIGHDDNFGPNFCIPRLYVKPFQATYVAELVRSDTRYGGIIAEVQALQFLYSLAPHLISENKWIERLRIHAHPQVQRVVLRAICIKKDNYLKYLKELSDWESNHERSTFVTQLAGLLPDQLWVVEISIPHLFPANERKLGEILLNPLVEYDESKDVDFQLFLLARLPGTYYLLKAVNQHGPNFVTIPSRLASHTPVIRTVQE